MRNFKFICILLVLCSTAYSQYAPLITNNLRVTRNTKFRKLTYKLDAPSQPRTAVVVIEGNNIVVDFNNSSMIGSSKAKTPDEFAGVAVLIRNSKKVTIKNLKARGYKIAIMARDVSELTLENCDLSYNYRQRLNSTQEKEDISDWMSYHHNEKDEWMRYGAAIYLRNCDLALIRNCRVTGGQNALMMTECDNGKIFNNDFSFNSGIGIGMYRCNANEISYNRVNFNVRGYSHGVYNRGQDSAGILIYEQSNYNVFYKNSVTHGGDGFFLWAGQTTMDTGKGGCNDNVLLENDFSYAPTNGIEVTFSRNLISGNRIFECDHGIWGGYSFESTISNNQFRDNRIAIAIEHGQQNRIINNIFSKDREAVRLWARKEQPADWGYAKYRDTRSRDYLVARNSFNNNKTVFNLARTSGLSIFGNTYFGDSVRFKIDTTVYDLDTLSGKEPEIRDTLVRFPVIEKPNDPFKGNGRFAGRKNILVTEWGPYDYGYPIIWNTNPVDSGSIMHFDLLGPPGKWRIRQYRGVKNLSAMSGVFPASLKAEKLPGDRTDILIELEYNGPAFKTAFGELLLANKPHAFRFRKFFQPINWEVNFYSLDTSYHNPIRTGTLFSPTEKKPPFRSEQPKKLDYAWWGGIREKGVQYPAFITLAQGSAEFLKGTYELSVTWDDAVRVYVDDKLLVDEWNPSRYTFDESPNKKIRVNLGGNHSIRVEHLELGGFATLAVKIKPAN